MPETKIEIKQLATPIELNLGFETLKELRPHLNATQFHEIYTAAHEANGYVLVGLFQDQRCVAVMGYRVIHNFVHGKHLYVDDLVTTESVRSIGLGTKLLKFAEAEAERLGCKGLRLCTGIENERGKRFYEREGWTLRAVAFKKQLAVSKDSHV